MLTLTFTAHPLHLSVTYQVYELDGAELTLSKEIEKPSSFKCGTFGASSLVDRRLATGNFAGQLQIWDLEHTQKPVYDVQAHASIVNQMDGFGGQASWCGRPSSRIGAFNSQSVYRATSK